MADKKQRLALAICEFLESSVEDGSIKQDDKEGIEVAIQCISEAFGVDVADEAQKKQLSVKPANLMQIFDVFLKTEAKRSSASNSSSTPAPATAAAAPAASSSSSTASTPSAADIAAADKLKGEGNSMMASKKYSEAISKYSQAIEKNPNNPVYYSNRAAAHSQAGDHSKAIEDAEKAKGLDKDFVKAYSRLGHAYFSLGKYSEAVAAYERGVELEPANASMKASLATAKSRAAESDDADYDDEDSGSRGMTSPSPPTAAGNGGGNPFAGMGGGGGGMPDLASLMNNPQMQAMAQQMMANGGLERMMQNPMLRQMAERFGQGGGMPDMSSLAGLMNDPSIRQMAEQFGGGAGGRGAGGNNNNNANNPDMYS